MRTLCKAWLVVAFVALGLSLAFHLSAMFGRFVVNFWWVLGMHLGLFLAFLPGAYVLYRVGGRYWRRPSMGAMMEASQRYWRFLGRAPKRMLSLLSILAGYFALHFLLFIVTGTERDARTGESSEDIPRSFLLVLSAAWMTFYWYLFTLYTVAKEVRFRRCAYGHPVPPELSYCIECFGPVDDS